MFTSVGYENLPTDPPCARHPDPPRKPTPRVQFIIGIVRRDDEVMLVSERLGADRHPSSLHGALTLFG